MNIRYLRLKRVDLLNQIILLW